MPFDPRPTEAHKAIIGQLLREDAELRDMARRFVVLGMREMVDQLHRGDAATRAAIAKSLAGTLTKAITETGGDDGDDTLRAEMHQMMDEMRDTIAPTSDPVAKRLVPKK